MQIQITNPVTGLDYPDPDVIRVGDAYYMVSTTMHFMPGGEILRSYDLGNWEHVSYVYDRLDSTPGQTLTGEEHIYGKGMWAASLRFHKGFFYVCFTSNDTGKTYLYTAQSVQGPWEKHYIEGFYYDNSLLFDEDGSVYIAHGNRDVFITQLKEDLSGPLEGGLNRLAVSDAGNPMLGYEGSHFYKINGKYYLFLIHSLRDRWMRTQACFQADSLEGEFTGGDVLCDDMGYFGQGVAQGGIVDTPEGKWFGVLFQDTGAVGRIPVLVPVHWDEDRPVIGETGKAPRTVALSSGRPDYPYKPLVQSDDFRDGELDSRGKEQEPDFGCFGLKSPWQFNHEPELSLLRLDREAGMLWVTTDKLCAGLTQARNILTQRMLYPGCGAEVTVDVSGLKEGDYAGICALQGGYGMVSAAKKDGVCCLVMKAVATDDALDTPKDLQEQEWESVEITESRVRLRVEADFAGMRDEARFFYWHCGGWKKIGVTHKLHFKLDHFVGCRFGLFLYSTLETGGRAGFADFVYTAH